MRGPPAVVRSGASQYPAPASFRGARTRVPPSACSVDRAGQRCCRPALRRSAADRIDVRGSSAPQEPPAAPRRRPVAPVPSHHPFRPTAPESDAPGVLTRSYAVDSAVSTRAQRTAATSVFAAESPSPVGWPFPFPGNPGQPRVRRNFASLNRGKQDDRTSDAGASRNRVQNSIRMCPRAPGYAPTLGADFERFVEFAIHPVGKDCARSPLGTGFPAIQLAICAQLIIFPFEFGGIDRRCVLSVPQRLGLAIIFRQFGYCRRAGSGRPSQCIVDG